MAVARTCAVECRRRSMSVIYARISGVLRSSCILLGSEINHEEHEGHGEFRFVLSVCETRAFWGARAASPQCSAACRAQNPVGKLPTVAGKLPTLPGEPEANGA